MRKKYVISIILFMLILLGPSLAWNLGRCLIPDFLQKHEYDLGEKRKKANIEWSELVDTGDSIGEYYSDRAPFRSDLIFLYQEVDGKIEKFYDRNLKKIIRDCLYKQKQASGFNLFTYKSFVNKKLGLSAMKNTVKLICDDKADHIHKWVFLEKVNADIDRCGYTLYQCSICKEKKTEEIVPRLVDDIPLSLTILNNNTIIGKNEWLFFNGNKSIEYYKGTNLLSEETLEEYKNKVNTLQELCDQKQISLCIMFLPNKEQIYDAYMPDLEVVESYKRLDRMVDYLREHTQTLIVYPKEELVYGDLFHQTYYKYDTHWNSYGAFIGVQELYKALGKDYVDPYFANGKLELAGEHDLINIGGLNEDNYAPDYEFCIEYKPDLSVTTNSKTDYKDAVIYRTYADTDNQDKMVLLSDSFRIMMIPYLVKDFSKCTILHRDSVLDVIPDIQEANYLIITAVERKDEEMFKTVDELIEILSE